MHNIHWVAQSYNFEKNKVWIIHQNYSFTTLCLPHLYKPNATKNNYKIYKKFKKSSLESSIKQKKILIFFGRYSGSYKFVFGIKYPPFLLIVKEKNAKFGAIE